MSNQNAPLAALREEWALINYEFDYVAQEVATASPRFDELQRFVPAVAQQRRLIERLFARAEAAERQAEGRQKQLAIEARRCGEAELKVVALQARVAALEAGLRELLDDGAEPAWGTGLILPRITEAHADRLRALLAGAQETKP